MNCIPCVSNEMPEEVYEVDELVGYDPNTIPRNLGAVVLVEGVLYSDDQGDQDYAKYTSFPGFFFRPGFIHLDVVNF